MCSRIRAASSSGNDQLQAEADFNPTSSILNGNRKQEPIVDALASQLPSIGHSQRIPLDGHWRELLDDECGHLASNLLLQRLVDGAQIGRLGRCQ